MLVLSRVTETVPVSVETVPPEALTMLPSMLPSMLPVKLLPSVRLSVSLESPPTLIAPDRTCAMAFRVAVLLPPLQPSAQTESRMLSPSSFAILTFLSVMTALVFVTWKTWPFLLVRLASSYTVKFT